MSSVPTHCRQGTPVPGVEGPNGPRGTSGGVGPRAVSDPGRCRTSKSRGVTYEYFICCRGRAPTDRLGTFLTHGQRQWLE